MKFPDIRVSASIEQINHPHFASSMIRIISGKFRGRRLRVPEGRDVRPTTDRVREALFGMLEHRIVWPEMAVLDLFAGSGALGLEALSRGLVNRVVADAEFDNEIQATTARIVSGAPLVSRTTKKFLRRIVGPGADPAPLTQAEIDEGYALCDSKDYAEGMRAFLAKQKPTFEGR